MTDTPRRQHRTYTDDQRRHALDLYQQYGPSFVHQQTGIPRSTVRSWAKAAGLRTVRNQRTSAATQARITDLKAVRTQLSGDTLQGAEEALELIRRHMRNGETRHARDVAVVYGILVDKHQALAAQDSDNGVDEMESMLSRLAQQLGGPLAEEYAH